MRLQEIEKEADMFTAEDEAYVHIEKVKGKDMEVVTSGGRAGLSLAGYVLLIDIAEAIGTKPMSLLRFYKQMWKKHGNIKHNTE